MPTLNLNQAVTAMFNGLHVRGKVVGKSTNTYLVQVDASDIPALLKSGYGYHTINVHEAHLKVR